jgi:hypothetical protein
MYVQNKQTEKCIRHIHDGTRGTSPSKKRKIYDKERKVVSIGVTRVLTWVIFKKGHAGLNPKIEMSRLIVMLVLFNICSLV